MQNILSLDFDQLSQVLVELGEKKFRAKQVWQWLHEKRITSFRQMRNLSASLQSLLEDNFYIYSLTELECKVAGDSLTAKWLYSTEDGTAMMEAVLIREIRGKRRTLCVSCMSGCPVGCVFCATGQGGYERNLESGEIVEQIYRADKYCREIDGKSLTNVVFMGMGEPLMNYDAVLKTTKLITDESGMNLSGRHITISTVGVPSGIERLAAEGVNYRLAISLHAPEQKLREELIPVAKKWQLQDLIKSLKTFSRSASRHITIEYCLIDKLNDSKSQARELADLLRGIPCKINLIPLNPTEGFEHSPPAAERIRAFQSTLEKEGYATLLREEKGRDINAACGQLRLEKKFNK